MRISAISLGTATLVATAVLAAVPAEVPADARPDDTPPTSTFQGPTIQLNGPRALAELQRTNPRHYAKVQRILAAASVLCRPGPPAWYAATFQAQAQDIKCVDSIFYTSNPAKRRITFRLDDTRYAALVTVLEPEPRLLRAGPDAPVTAPAR